MNVELTVEESKDLAIACNALNILPEEFCRQAIMDKVNVAVKAYQFGFGEGVVESQ